MRGRLPAVVARLHRPEHTGENRCTSCTVVNVVLAAALCALLVPISLWLALPALGACLAAIALRGYLVPGTPALTARYLPDRLHRRFHGSADPRIGTTGAAGEDLDAERVLREAGVLEPTSDGTDLRLADGFAVAWRDRIEAVRGGAYEPRLARLLSETADADPAAIEVRADDGTVIVDHDGDSIALWPSEAALIADLAAAAILHDRLPGWTDIGVPRRGQLLHSVRLFGERCPACDGDLTFSEETVRSCCTTGEVVTLACGACGATVLEVGV